MTQNDSKTFDPFDPKYAALESPHGPVNIAGEWEWEMRETYAGLPSVIATLWRDPYTLETFTKTTSCPFCKQRHLHGMGDGHRSPHCADKHVKPKATLSDGITVFQKDGYIVRTRPQPLARLKKR